jgi:hypothetical protein
MRRRAGVGNGSDTFVAIVEEATGRKVRAFLSQNHIGSDLAAEILVLEAAPEEIRHGRGDDRRGTVERCFLATTFHGRTLVCDLTRVRLPFAVACFP